MKAGRWWPFVAMCALAATSWMLAERVRFTLWDDAVSCAFGAVICGLVARRERGFRWRASVGGMMVVVGPALAALSGVYGGGGLSIALTLTGVVVAVAAPALCGSEFVPGDLWPGLAAAAALLIAEPVPGLGNWRTDLVLIAAPLVTGVGAVWFSFGGGSAARRMCGALAMAAVVFGAAAGVRREWVFHVSVAGVAVVGGLFVLALLALTRISVAQYAARYAIVPLALLVEGVAMVSRELLSVRTVLCAVLLAAASVAMLRRSRERGVEGFSEGA